MTQAQILKAAGCANTPAGRKKFYKMYPDKKAFEMACGGALPRAQDGFDFNNSTEAIYGDSPYTDQPIITGFNNPGNAKISITSRSYPAPIPAPAPVATNGFQPFVGKRTRDTSSTRGGKINYLPDTGLPSGPSNYFGKGGPVFPQIQSADGFFSMGFENVPAPYQGGSFQNGGTKYIPQPQKLDWNDPNQRLEIYKQSGWDNGNKWAVENGYATPSDTLNTKYVTKIDPNKSMHRLLVGVNIPPYMQVGGSPGEVFHAAAPFPKNGRQAYGRPTYGSKWIAKKGGQADFNQGPEYFTNKLNSFTEHLRNTALSATEQEMNNQHMMPDGSMMQGPPMAHGGTPEMFPYAMPYQYADGGIHIDPSKRGTFTAAANKRGQSVQGFASRVMANKDQYSSAMVKKANFAKNAAGWKKQEGGEQDQVQQLIMAYAQQVGVAPEEIMAKLQEMPEEEQQQALQQMAQEVQGGDQGEQEEMMQAGGPMINPDAMNSIKMYDNAYNQASNNANTLGGIMNFADASSKLNYYQGGGNISQKDFQVWLDEYFKANPQSAQRYHSGDSANQDGRYSYAPANIVPSIKFKNVKTYINGMPMNGQYPAGTASTKPGMPNIAGMAGLSGLPGFDPAKFKVTSAPRLLGRKYTWEYGTPPAGMSEEKKRSWVGQRLHDMGPNIDKYRTPFPSKKRKQEYADDQAWDAKQAQRRAAEAQTAEELKAYQDEMLSRPRIPGQASMFDQGYPEAPGEYTPPVPQAPFVTSSENPSAPSLQDFIRDQVSPYHRDSRYVTADPANQAAMDDSIRRGEEEQRLAEADSQFPGVNPNGMRRGGSYQVGGQYDMTNEEIQKLIDGGYEFDFLD